MKLAALLIALPLLVAPAGAPTQPEEPAATPPVSLGTCVLREETEDPSGRRYAIFTCDSGAIVFLPQEARDGIEI